jgi:hypothetical protein
MPESGVLLIDKAKAGEAVSARFRLGLLSAAPRPEPSSGSQRSSASPDATAGTSGSRESGRGQGEGSRRLRDGGRLGVPKDPRRDLFRREKGRQARSRPVRGLRVAPEMEAGWRKRARHGSVHDNSIGRLDALRL